MSDQTKGGIAWTDQTWNPVRGCSRVSAGCENCYAERMAARFCGTGQPYEGIARMVERRRTLRRDFANGSTELRQVTDRFPRWTGEVKLVHEHMLDPIRWKRPRRVFVNSMSDLFHEKLSFTDIAAIFGIMASAPQHTFQVLTKRPHRARQFFEWVVKQDTDTKDATPGRAHVIMSALDWEREHIVKAPGETLHKKRCADPSGPWPLPNVWIGVSVEDQAAANDRVFHLWDIPAAVHFLSCEPLVGPVDLKNIDIFHRRQEPWKDSVQCSFNALSGHMAGPDELLGRRIDWVIVGGESGPNARPMPLEWARSLRNQCAVYGVPFFFKQLSQADSKTYDDPSTFPEDLRIREFPEVKS